jgi:fructokinase
VKTGRPSGTTGCINKQLVIVSTMSTSTLTNKDPVIVAAVEGGGTTFVVAVAEVIPYLNKVKILVQTEIDSTGSPQDTLQATAEFLEKRKPPGGYHALGLACFGPLGVNPSLTTYGCILGTSPKAIWRNVNLLEPLKKACEGPDRPLILKVDTDVNAPALAEFLLEKDISSIAYITVGTGVGVGLVVHGQCVHGRMHPEAGHVPVQPLDGDPFTGYSWGISHSPFQGKNTVEGVACSVALTERLEQLLGQANLNRDVLKSLPDDHEVWDHAANALANLCVTLLLTVSVERIVLGGGVMKRHGLLNKIQKRTVELLNGYLELPDDMSTLISEPKYGDRAGLYGAIALAQKSIEDKVEAQDSSLFFHGLWHGVLIGAVAAYVLFAAVNKVRR